MSRKTEVFVETLGHRDMLGVWRPVGVVGRSVEAGVGEVPVPVLELGRKQGGLNLLLQACAERREQFTRIRG